ncbi:hypothetical protein ACQV2B_02800 [Pantoea allii]|uniref:hypothetical protein n=1 Tax=Pantoea allii TaxID=574096 RepID=UPI003D3230F5
MSSNGGSAFPLPLGSETVSGADGMALRDYFAAKAMGGICAHAENWGLSPMRIAEMAYEMADKMLRARQEG